MIRPRSFRTRLSPWPTVFMTTIRMRGQWCDNSDHVGVSLGHQLTELIKKEVNVNYVNNSATREMWKWLLFCYFWERKKKNSASLIFPKTADSFYSSIFLINTKLYTVEFLGHGHFSLSHRKWVLPYFLLLFCTFSLILWHTISNPAKTKKEVHLHDVLTDEWRDLTVPTNQRRHVQLAGRSLETVRTLGIWCVLIAYLWLLHYYPILLLQTMNLIDCVNLLKSKGFKYYSSQTEEHWLMLDIITPSF